MELRDTSKEATTKMRNELFNIRSELNTQDPKELGEPIFEEFFPKLSELIVNFAEITGM